MDTGTVRDKFSEIREKITENKKIVSVIAVVAVLLIALAISMSIGVLPSWMSPKFGIESDTTSLEVGETTDLKALTPLSPDTYHFEWTSSNPEVGIIEGSGKEISFVAKKPGQTTITLQVDGRAVKQPIRVFSKAFIDLSLPESWIYLGNAYDYALDYPKDSVNISDVYVEDSNHQRLPDDQFFKSVYGEKKLFVSNEAAPGNYELVVKGTAQSDGRTVMNAVPFTALTQIQKGYYKFSLANENLLAIEPWHYSAIENFIDNELDINLDLSNVKTRGDTLKVSSFRSEYVFYRDPTRTDTLCYEKDVSVSGSSSDAKNFYKLSTRARDGSMWTVASDGIIFLIYPEGYEFDYYMENQNPGTTNPGYSNPGHSNPGYNNPGTAAPGNNDPSKGETNIPSPRPPI